MANQDDYVRVTLRLPPDLHRQIEGMATRNERSLNAEIIVQMRKSYESDVNGIPVPRSPLLDGLYNQLALLDAALKAGMPSEPFEFFPF